MSKLKVGIMGFGQMGITMTFLLNESNVDISALVTSNNASDAEELAEYITYHRKHPPEKDGRKPRKLQHLNLKIPDNVKVSANLEEVVNGKDIVVCAIPSKAVKEYLYAIKDMDFKYFINTTKGIIDDDIIYETFKDILGKKPYATISGGMIAEEIAQSFESETKPYPAFANIAFNKRIFRLPLHHVFGNRRIRKHLRLYHSPDIRSIEYSSIQKQVYSIILGACKGINVPSNTYNGMIQICQNEIAGLMLEQGYNPKVFLKSFAGIPDLLVTAEKGRHGKFGALIGQTGSVQQAKKEMEGYTIEGLRILESEYKYAKNHLEKVPPVLNTAHRVIYQGKEIMREIDILINLATPRI